MQQRALGRKVSDEFTVPLCRSHHRVSCIVAAMSPHDGAGSESILFRLQRLSGRKRAQLSRLLRSRTNINQRLRQQ
jgi:hypothetical protein